MAWRPPQEDAANKGEAADPPDAPTQAPEDTAHRGKTARTTSPLNEMDDWPAGDMAIPPFPEAQPWKPSKRYRMLMLVSSLLSKLKRK